MQLSPYGCISTGDEVGMIEVVVDSATTASITRSAGGATAVLKKSPIANWLSEFNRTRNPQLDCPCKYKLLTILLK